MRTVCYTTFIRITSMSPTEVTAQEIRNKIEKKQLQPTENEAIIADDTQEDERTPTNTARPGSSTSTTTTFFSAQDESLETDLSISPRVNAASKTQVCNVFACDDDKQEKCQSVSASIYLQGISLVIMRDVNDKAHRMEVASLSITDTILIMDSKSATSNLSIYVGDLQLDNQMFEQGGFDFPVVLISQKPFVKKDVSIYLSNSLKKNIKNIVENSLLAVDLIWENNGDDRVCKEVAVKVAPISVYIEGSFATLLMEYASCMLPACLVATTGRTRPLQLQNCHDIRIPDHVLVDSRIISHPLRLRSFVIEPMSILLSVHTSVHLYVAFDHSPLYFEAFDRKNVVSTTYRLGNALAMHYLSGAIFGVGWVVGSLEILGSPGGLAQALGSGIKDFVSMPFRGLLQGPWGFIVGVTHGSASLVKHITAGTVNSVTKLASSVARNLDRLTLDDEHLQRQEEFRRTRPQGVAQGLYQGLTGLGMNLLAAVAGLAHHPLQQVMSGQTSTRGLVTGVGLGLVGVVTKPLSGAAELVALTGQGLLQGTGWNSMPSPRHRPIVQYSNGSSATSLRYAWRLMPLLTKSHDSILHVASADHALLQSGNRAVTLVLTRQALLIVNVLEDSVEKIYPLKDLVAADHPSESTMLRLYCSSGSPSQERRKTVTVEHLEVHMDQVMRARVAEFLRTSSTGIASVSTNSDEAQSEIMETVPTDAENCLTFYISSDSLGYLLSVFNVAKRQNQDHGFAVI